MIELRDYQRDWAVRAMENLDNHGCYIDTSEPGTGKTYLAGHIAQTIDLPIFVICPATLVSNWNNMCAEEGVRRVSVMSYESIRGVKRSQLNHDWLEQRVDVSVGPKGKRTDVVWYEPTVNWTDLVNSGVFLICDENQRAKNNNPTYRAVKTMIESVISSRRSRFALMSASPFDKEPHATNLMKLIGFIKSRNLYVIVSRRFVANGLQELIVKCNQLDRDTTRHIMRMHTPCKENIHRIVHMLCREVVNVHLCGAMIRPKDIYTHDVKNGFFIPTPDEEPVIKAAIEDLASTIGTNDPRTITSSTFESQCNLGRQLSALEKSKLGLFYRKARDILDSSSTGKVIISLSYFATIDALVELLATDNPLVLTGKTPMPRRFPLIASFNTDPTKRLLIMNTKVGGCGISLHDKHGGYPRTMLISPNYNLIDIYQAVGRINREGVASSTVVRIVYAHSDELRELRIMQSINSKSVTLGDSLARDAKEFVNLPCDYPSTSC